MLLLNLSRITEMIVNIYDRLRDPRDILDTRNTRLMSVAGRNIVISLTMRYLQVILITTLLTACNHNAR